MTNETQAIISAITTTTS